MSPVENLYTFIGDWLTKGLQTGPSRQEWTEDRTALKYTKNVHLNVNESPTAFIESDFEFRGSKELRLSTDSAPSLALISTVRIAWRY